MSSENIPSQLKNSELKMPQTGENRLMRLVTASSSPDIEKIFWTSLLVYQLHGTGWTYHSLNFYQQMKTNLRKGQIIGTEEKKYKFKTTERFADKKSYHYCLMYSLS